MKTDRRSHGKRLSPQEVERMREMRALGYQCGDIAYEFGVSTSSVTQYTRDVPLRRSTYLPPRNRATSFGGVNAERNARIVEKAKTLSLSAIAQEEGLTRERVRQIVASYQQATGEAVRGPNSRAKKAAKRKNPLSLAQRVLRHARLVPETGCWRWDGTRVRSNRSNHLQPRIGGALVRKLGLSQIASRATFHLWQGPLGSEHIEPTCGNWLCVNPFHWRRKTAPPIE